MRILSVIAIWCWAIVSWGQEAQLKVQLDTNAILIGEQAQLQLQMTLPQGQTALFPQLNDTLTALIPIVKHSPIDTILNESTQEIRLQQALTITAFDTGYLRIPPLPFGLQSQGDSSWQILHSKSLLLNVFTVAVDTTQDIKPIVMPLQQGYSLQEFWPWILMALGLLLLATGLWFYWRRRQGKASPFAKKAKPLLPPHTEAIEALEQLRHQKLWQRNLLKAYYTELTDITRHYIERRYNIMAMEMTSDEVMEALQDKTQNKEALDKLSSTFMIADLVKFAKGGASAIENDGCWHNCIDFVNETKAEDSSTADNKTEGGTDV